MSFDLLSYFLRSIVPLQLPEGEPDISPQAPTLIEELKRTPELAACFAKPSGVSEGYTIEEHTKMVLATAEKYRTTYQQNIERLVPWEHFLLFLALHDIGKGIALEKQGTFTNPVAFKEAELTHTCEIMVPILRERGVAPRSIALFTQLLRYDTIGLYLKGESLLKEARDQILEVAHRAHMDPEAVLSIFDAFHAYDSASYPALMHAIYDVERGALSRIVQHREKMDSLREQIHSPRRGEALFQRIQRAMVEGTLRELTRLEMQLLTDYVHSTHIMLLSSTEEELAERQQSFRALKRGIRDLLLYFSVGDSFHLFPLCSEPWASFEDTVIEFRHSYLTRYSQHKLIGHGSLVDRLQLKWVHGANSSILPGLLETRCLIPSGRLSRLGIVPLSGELDAGADGINKHKLSGTDLFAANRAMAYGAAYQTSAVEEMQVLEKYIPHMERCKITSASDTYLLGQKFARISFAIRRARIIALQQFEQIKPRLEQALENCRVAFKKYKTTKNYAIWMPSSLNPRCSRLLACLRIRHRFQWHDNTFLHDFNLFKKGVELAARAMSDPVIKLPGSEEFLDNPFPMIFGSRNRVTYLCARYRGGDTERNVIGTMVLGKDIQVVFVPDDKVDFVGDLFRERGIGGVEVSSIATLAQARDLHQSNVLKFEDIASEKKRREKRGLHTKN